jgi:hypothetical protein
MSKKQKSKKVYIRIAIPIILILLMLWSWVPVTERISLDLIDGDSEEIRIALITDLHSCYYGKNQNWLVRRIEKEKPDIVILGGDILDNRLSDENAHLLVEQVCSKYPTYYVSGNHEYWSGRIDEMKEYLKGTGVKVLEGDCDTISFGSSTLDICGIDDPTYLRNDEWEEQIRSAYDKTKDSHVKILVSHRPERVSTYEKYDFDLILTGHAHAGQFRIPFINKGLLAPDQGFMAKYVNGTYELSNGSIMEVSRGLARETTPLPRFFNHPEVVLLKLN